MQILFIGTENRWIEDIVLALRIRWGDIKPTVASKFSPALNLISRGEVDLIYLMQGASPNDMRSLLTQIRGLSNTPVIVVIRRTEEPSVLELIEQGADDYLSMPCNSIIITARAVAVLRRVGFSEEGQSDGIISCGELVVNPVTYEVLLGEQALTLTPTEFRLLYVLAKNKNSTLTQDFIQASIWSSEVSSDDSLKKYIQRLRLKLGDDARKPTWIRTIRGVGYVLMSPN